MPKHTNDNSGRALESLSACWVAYTPTVAVAWEERRFVDGSLARRMLGLHLYGEVTSQTIRNIPLRLIQTADPEDYPTWTVDLPGHATRSGEATLFDVGPPPGPRSIMSRFRGRKVVDASEHAPPPITSRDRAGGETVDDFYRRVARSYEYLAGVTGKPTTSMALQAQVSKETAARWVHQARKRGYLAATTRGKVTR